MPANDYRDGLRALDESQRKPCAYCQLRPRQTGDHACARCRARIKATYEQYQRAAPQETES